MISSTTRIFIIFITIIIEGRGGKEEERKMKKDNSGEESMGEIGREKPLRSWDFISSDEVIFSSVWCFSFGIGYFFFFFGVLKRVKREERRGEKVKEITVSSGSSGTLSLNKKKNIVNYNYYYKSRIIIVSKITKKRGKETKEQTIFRHKHLQEHPTVSKYCLTTSRDEKKIIFL